MRVFHISMQYRRRDLGSRFSRSAGALGCHTRIRAGFPRDGSRTVFYRSAGACPPRSPLASYVFRSYGSEENQRRFSVARAMARDRPSLYGEVPFFFAARGPSDATRASERVSPAMAQEPFFIVARGPVPRDLHWPVMFLGPTDLKRTRDVFSVARTMARDRPSPYGEVPFFFVSRGTGPRERWIARARAMARDRVSHRPTMKGGGLSAAAAPVGAPPYCIETGRSLLRVHRLH